MRHKHFNTLQSFSFFGLFALVAAVFFWMVSDLIGPIFWAVAFAIVFYPLYRRYTKWFRGRRSLASFLTIITILILVITPLYFLGKAVVEESLGLLDRVPDNGAVMETRETVRALLAPLDPYLDRFGVSEEDIISRGAEFFGAAAGWLTNQAVAFSQRTVSFTLQFFIMLYLLFFAFRDGGTIVQKIKDILPLGNAREERLFERFASITRGVIKGTIVIAIIQGTIGGFLFWFVGINAAALWGVVMTVLSVIPALGAGIVWFPAAVLLILGGDILSGIVVLLVGFFIIAFIDNILRPVLVGRDAKMPDVLIFVSTIGGLVAMGVTGFVIGPIAAGFFMAMAHMFEEEYKQDLETSG